MTNDPQPLRLSTAHPQGELTGGLPDSTPLSGELFEEIVRRVTLMMTAVEQVSGEVAPPQEVRQGFDAGDRSPPKAPRSVAETELGMTLLSSLILKWTSLQAEISEQGLADLVRLPAVVIQEVVGFLNSQGALERSVSEESGPRWRLTDSGRRRSAAAFAECRYVGPAPVSRRQYVQECARDAVSRLTFRRQPVRDGLKPLVVSPEFIDDLGAALCAGHSLLLYGDSGNGKTAIAHRIGEIVRQVGGAIHVPEAVALDRQIMTVFDPSWHQPVAEESGGGVSEDSDRRWRRIRRPVVVGPTTLHPGLFDLVAHESQGRVLHAPLHLKANGGVLLLDDLGRQRQLAEIADRWLRILEHQTDTFRVGLDRELTLPVTGLTLFVTHLSPAECFDSTLLRRLRSKVNIGSPAELQFREIFRNLCLERGIHYDDWVVLRCLNNRYNPQIPPKASDPRDLLDAIAAICRFQGESPRLTEDLLAQAFQKTVALNECSV